MQSRTTSDPDLGSRDYFMVDPPPELAVVCLRGAATVGCSVRLVFPRVHHPDADAWKARDVRLRRTRRAGVDSVAGGIVHCAVAVS